MSKKFIGIVATMALALSGVVSTAAPANAGTNVDVYYFGNTIGTQVPASITVDRDVVPLPGAASVTGSRTGYSFGGWSLTSGGAALTGSTYAFSSTAERLDLYAVWNTTITYDTNGADSGSLAGSKTSDTYRFGQSLALPTAGTLVKSGFAFGGWMATSVSNTRITSYQAGSTEDGNRTLYAAWIKTVGFNANGGTLGNVPPSMVYVAGGERLRLPVASEMTLRRPGYQFMGWSTSPTGTVTSSPDSYVPIVSQRTLFAIWKLQSTKATSRVFFKLAKSNLRAAQKLILQDLVATLKTATNINISLSATRPRGAAFALGKARNKAVVDYLKSQGIVATYLRSNNVGSGVLLNAPKNNRVTIQATWTNPTN